MGLFFSPFTMQRHLIATVATAALLTLAGTAQAQTSDLSTYVEVGYAQIVFRHHVGASDPGIATAGDAHAVPTELAGHGVGSALVALDGGGLLAQEATAGELVVFVLAAAPFCGFDGHVALHRAIGGCDIRTTKQRVVIQPTPGFCVEQCIHAQPMHRLDPRIAAWEGGVELDDFVDAKVSAGGDIFIHGSPKQINQKVLIGGTITEVKR